MARWASRGFTLVELLIVIVVIAILAAITIVAYGGVTSKAHTAAMKSNFSQASTLLESYRVTNGAYPADQPSAVTAGLKADSNTTIAYSANPSYDQYCLSETSNGSTYSMTSADKTPTVGDCTGLVGWWTFDGGSTNDMSGYGNNATNVGATATTGQDGRANNAYSFDGTDKMTCGSDTSLDPTSAVTVSGWIYPTTFGTANANYDPIINNGSGGYWLYLAVSSGALGGAAMYLQTSATTISPASTPALATNNWYFVVATYNGSADTVYVNGQQVLSTSITGSVTGYSSGNGCLLGVIKSTSGRYLIGSLDDVRVYNRALSANEIQALYNAGAQ